LPLHAAWKVDEQDPAKRCYAIDKLTFRYAPNARSFLAAHRSAKQLTLGKVLAVESPYPSRLPQLPGATAEIESVLKCCEGRVTLLRREEATRAAVIKMLPEFSVLHFACHGRVVPFRPLESGLFLAHDETLSLRDLLSLRLTNVRLAILSACDTAVTDVGLLDESIGLPGGLMIAGADGVIGSLWQLSDVHAMLLMARFYDEWTSKGLEPGEALATAQRWMRAATKNEKHEYFKANFARPEAEDMQKLIMSLDSNSQHPYFWSSFCYTGV
jgi:CHAT domain-containing protein